MCVCGRFVHGSGACSALGVLSFIRRGAEFFILRCLAAALTADWLVCAWRHPGTFTCHSF